MICARTTWLSDDKPNMQISSWLSTSAMNFRPAWWQHHAISRIWFLFLVASTLICVRVLSVCVCTLMVCLCVVCVSAWEEYTLEPFLSWSPPWQQSIDESTLSHRHCDCVQRHELIRNEALGGAGISTRVPSFPTPTPSKWLYAVCSAPA